MKRFFAPLIFLGLIYGGYIYYLQLSSSQPLPPIQTQGKVIISHASDTLGNLASVLGTSISNLVTNGQDYLSDVTDGTSEPIINQLVTKTQETLKDLPRKEAEKIKYEFCRGIITEYESSSSPSPSQQP